MFQRMVAGLLAMSALASPAVTGPQTTGLGSIEGVIVRLGTGEPIIGVNVELRRVEGTADSPLGPLVFSTGYFSPGAIVTAGSTNPSDIANTRTTEGGRFAFANLKPGKYRLFAVHPWGPYYPAEYGQRNPRAPGYDFPLQTGHLNVRIEMAPMASVSGRVIGADGKAAARVHVLAAEIAYRNGALVLNQVQGAETNDRGDYRLFWLPPGRYYVGAFPEGLRRRQTAVPAGPPGQVESMNQTFPQALIQYRAGANGEVLEDVYETVYAPGATNLQAARIVDLRSGADVTGIDIPLTAGQRSAVRIRGVVLDGTTGQPLPAITVRAAPRVDGPVLFSLTGTTDELGRFEIAGVMPGNYTVIATQTVNLVRHSAVQTLDVGSNGVDGLKLLVTAGLRINGRITLEGSPTDDEYRVVLTPTVSPIPYPSVQSFSGTFSSAGVYAGNNYRVDVIATKGSLGSMGQSYVKTVKWGGVELTDREFRPGDSVPGELEVDIGRNGGALEGTVVDARRSPAVNVMVAVVPVGSRRLDRYKTGTTDNTGRFRLQGLPPGNYLAIAFPWMKKGVEQYPEFLRTIENRATAVSINEGSNRNIELTLQPELDF